MGFTGFPDEGLIFYERLEADNTRTFWTANRTDYDVHVRAPIQSLVDDLTAEFGEPKIFRPYRDVRFSNDKTPYKTHQGAVLHQAGNAPSAVYVEISAAGLRVSGGCWRLATDQLQRYRRAVDDDLHGSRLEGEVQRLRRAGLSIGGDQLIRAPRGYDVDHPRIDLLRHKSLHASATWEPADWLHTGEAAERVRAAWRETVALGRWLANNVGVSTVPPDERR